MLSTLGSFLPLSWKTLTDLINLVHVARTERKKSEIFWAQSANAENEKRLKENNSINLDVYFYVLVFRLFQVIIRFYSVVSHHFSFIMYIYYIVIL